MHPWANAQHAGHSGASAHPCSGPSVSSLAPQAGSTGILLAGPWGEAEGALCIARGWHAAFLNIATPDLPGAGKATRQSTRGTYPKIHHFRTWFCSRLGEQGRLPGVRRRVAGWVLWSLQVQLA